MRTHRLDVLASVLDHDADASLATRQGGPAPSSAGEPTEPASPRAARLREGVSPTTRGRVQPASRCPAARERAHELAGRLTVDLLRAFSRASVGDRHPPRDKVARAGLSAVDTVSAR